jgi:hypothetical protein
VETAYHFVERDGETFVRHHERRLGAGVYLRQRERNRANVVYLTPAFIDVDEVKGLDLQAALRLSASLLDAVDALDEIAAAELWAPIHDLA